MKRMDVRWQCLIANVSLIAATVSGSASAEPLVVGWVLQGDKGELASPDQISVSRKQPGSALPPNQLAACDRVDLKGGGSFFLLLASGARMRLDSANPSRAVPCNETGVPERLALALRALATEPAPATNQVLTVTRGDQFDIPAIGSRVTKLVEGSRAIFVPWRGGQAPYSISLFREKESRALVQEVNLRSTASALPVTKLVPGRYVLEVRSGDGSFVKEQDLIVVKRSELPAPPREVESEGLSEAERALLYSYALEMLADGEWTLEGLQALVPFSESNNAVSARLRRFGAP